MVRHRHRKLRGRKLKQQRRIIITSALALTLLLSTGYAAFSTNISLSAKGNIKEKEKKAAETLVENETVQEASSTVDGLYQDTYEEPVDGKYRYIYKGADPNNYIEFNDEVWRIYSIEPDGSIKIIRDALYNTRVVFDPSGNNGRRTSGYCSHSSAKNSGCNVWAATSNLVGAPSSFLNQSASGTVTGDSAMLTYLNSGTFWTIGLNNTAKGQIEAHDWNVGPADWNTATSAVASTTYEGKYKWKGNIALLTASEYIRANSNTSTYCTSTPESLSLYYTSCRDTNWLYSSSITSNWWLLSPRSYSYAYVFTAYTDGYIANLGYAYEMFGVRPALYLSSSIKLTGKGTNDSNIYKIS